MDKAQENQLLSFENFQKRSQQQTALARLSAGFATSLRKDEICKEISRRLFEIQGYEYVAVYLINEKDGNHYLIDSVGYLGFQNPTQLLPGDRTLKEALKDKDLKYTPDVSKNPKHITGCGKGSEIAVPILFDQEIMGVIVVKNKAIGIFEPADFAMITTVADQAALALQNTRLLMSETRRRIEAEALATQL